MSWIFCFDLFLTQIFNFCQKSKVGDIILEEVKLHILHRQEVQENNKIKQTIK